MARIVPAAGGAILRAHPLGSSAAGRSKTMKPISRRRTAGLVAALALALGTSGVASAQAVLPDGSPAVPQSGDQMAVGSQPALPSCAERPSGNQLGPATGPVTAYAPGTDAMGAT